MIARGVISKTTPNYSARTRHSKRQIERNFRHGDVFPNIPPVEGQTRVKASLELHPIPKINRLECDVSLRDAPSESEGILKIGI